MRSKSSETPSPRDALKAWLRQQLRLAYATLRRALGKAARERRLWLAVGLGLAAVVAVNMAVRRTGGSVHPLSVFRVRERARALVLYGAHRATCSCDADVAAVLRAAAVRHRVPFRLVLSVARAESGLVHTRISSTGAMGVMQLMPETARALALADPFDVQENADGGVRYLKQQLITYRGNRRRALAAYNAGPGRIPRKGPLSLSSETQSYVTRILSSL